MHTAVAPTHAISLVLLVTDPAGKKALMDAPSLIVTELTSAGIDRCRLFDIPRRDALEFASTIPIVAVKARPRTLDRMRRDIAVLLNGSRALRDHARAACENSRMRVTLTRRLLDRII